MEFVYPHNKSVVTADPAFPLAPLAFRRPQMVSVNQESELIYFSSKFKDQGIVKDMFLHCNYYIELYPK